MTSPIRIVIADDHTIVRKGIRAVLRNLPDIEVVGEASNGWEAIAKVGELQPDVVLMDLVMPGMDGIEATRQIRAISPDTKVIVLTSFSDDDKVFPAIKAGAAGYLLKDVSPPDLAQAIQAAHRGETPLHPDITTRLMNQFVSPGVEPAPVSSELTPRELEVLGLIAQGMNNRQIALALTISEKTVKTHVSNILGKLRLADRTQAAIYAYKHGLVSED
jgi:NarL family two-component system response regulator LiaR